MEIYLVRHGLAEDPGHVRQDSERRLTEEGREKTRKVARAFRKRVPRLSAIFHSPYQRALETAQLFAEEFPDAKIQSAPGLTPHDSAAAALPLFAGHGDGEAVMVVGHEPHLSTLASLLITGRERPVLEFKKAGIAGIETLGSLQHCRLLFLLSPKWF